MLQVNTFSLSLFLSSSGPYYTFLCLSVVLFFYPTFTFPKWSSFLLFLLFLSIHFLSSILPLFYFPRLSSFPFFSSYIVVCFYVSFFLFEPIPPTSLSLYPASVCLSPCRSFYSPSVILRNVIVSFCFICGVNARVAMLCPRSEVRAQRSKRRLGMFYFFSFLK